MNTQKIEAKRRIRPKGKNIKIKLILKTDHYETEDALSLSTKDVFTISCGCKQLQFSL